MSSQYLSKTPWNVNWKNVPFNSSVPFNQTYYINIYLYKYLYNFYVKCKLYRVKILPKVGT